LKGMYENWDMDCGVAAYVFDQGALVLEGVTLAEMVEFVVEMLVDFASCTILDEKASEDP
jgi:hypothetical protein